MIFCVADIVRIRWGCCCCGFSCFGKSRSKIRKSKLKQQQKYACGTCAPTPPKMTMVDTMPSEPEKPKQKRHHRKLTFYDNTYLLDPASCDTFVVMCLVLSIYCIILALPETVFSYIVDFLIIERFEYISDDFRFESRRRLGRTLCSMFHDILLSTKIIIYLLWPTFRVTLKKLFCCRKGSSHDTLSDSEQAYKEPLTRGSSHRCSDIRDSFSNTITVV